MPFVPVAFAKFGGTTNDLLTQKFEQSDLQKQVSVKSTQDNLSIISNLAATGDSAIAGKVTLKYVNKNGLDGSLEVNNKGDARLKVVKRRPGFMLSHDFARQDGKNVVKVETEWSRANLAYGTNYNGKNKDWTASFVYGNDGVSLGAALTANIPKLFRPEEGVARAESLKPAVGIQFEDGNLIGAITIDGDKKATVSAFHRLNYDFQMAARVQTSPTEHKLAFGGQYKINPCTVAKVKTEINQLGDSTHSAFVQHRMANPNVTVGVSAQYTNLKGSAIGVNLAFTE